MIAASPTLLMLSIPGLVSQPGIGGTHGHDWPSLQSVLFVLVLLCYLLTLMGNLALAAGGASLHMRLHTPMYCFLCHLTLMDTIMLIHESLRNLKPFVFTLNPQQPAAHQALNPLILV